MKHAFVPLLLCTSFGLSGCAGGSSSDVDTVKIGAYSVVREAFHEGIVPAFKAYWKQKTGRDVKFEESYNASGAQARAIAAGFDADVAILSHEGDMDTLVDSGHVASSWRESAHRGMLTNSVVAIGFREGNPKGINGWSDLERSDVSVLYPDPKTSGGARWNINAIYGAALLSAGGPEAADAVQAARKHLTRVQKNVVNMDSSGRQSMANFAERGIGDAVVTYENELLLRAKQGKPIPFLVPDATLLIESPLAVVQLSVERHRNRQVVEAFVEFLRSNEGQRILADFGFRPMDPALAQSLQLAKPAKLFTMSDLGGWGRVQQELYGPQGLWTTIFDEHSGDKQ
jgi:sulfate transport system substrate-binding protein